MPTYLQNLGRLTLQLCRQVSGVLEGEENLKTLVGLPLLFSAWAILGLAYAGLERLVRSPWGRVLRAIREDETAAESLGKRAFVFRLQSFVLGCMLMGLGGALYVHFVGYIAPEDFLPILTFQLWTMLIVGGSGNNRGAILGAFVVWALWTVAGGAVQTSPRSALGANSRVS